MGFSSLNLLSQVEGLSRSVADDPEGFLRYLGTLEVEHQRLTEATETLTARNLELRGIIERASRNFVQGRIRNDKEFTDSLVKRIAQLNEEIRDLKDCQEVNRLLKVQNKLLQDERQYRTDVVMNQATNIDKEYTRLSGVLYEYGVNAARLRSERDILKHNLDVTRRSGEIENAILRKEFDTKIAALNLAYDKLRAEVRTEISSLERKEKAMGLDVDLCRKTWAGFLDTNVPIKSQHDSSYSSDEYTDDLLEDRFFQLQLAVLTLQNENKRLQGELDATQHVFTELAFSKTQKKQLRVDISALASKFSEISSDALKTFNNGFEKAINTAWNNFGKLRLTMDDQLRGDVDEGAAARIIAFSELVCKFGQLPLSNMEQDVRALVNTTVEHFEDLQERLDALGCVVDDITNSKSCQPHQRNECETFEGQEESKGDLDHAYLKYLRLAYGDNDFDDSTNCDSSMIGPLLASKVDTSSERCNSESEMFHEQWGSAREHSMAENTHKEAAEAELSWLERAFPKLDSSRSTV